MPEPSGPVLFIGGLTILLILMIVPVTLVMAEDSEERNAPTRCGPMMTQLQYQESVNAAAAEAALPKFLVAALVHTESQWYENENAVSL